MEQKLDYEIVKAAVLNAYEHIPEAYRQSLRNSAKSASQAYVEFAHEKSTLFDNGARQVV